MSLRSMLSLIVVPLFVAWLVACGGGSVSGGGGSGSTSNLVVKLNSNGTASFKAGPGLKNRMVAALSDLLIREAMAMQPEDHQVCLFDTTNVPLGCTSTNTNGEAFFLVDPASYTVCFETGDPVTSPDMCMGPIVVPEGELVVATVECIDTECSLVSAVSSPRNENPDAFQDPDKANKTILCHKPDGPSPQTLSVATESVPAHLAHGDSLGQCPTEPAISSTEEITTDDGPGKSGNNGNNGNKFGNSGKNT